MAIPHGCFDHLDTCGGHRSTKTKVRHDRHHNGVTGEHTSRAHVACEDGDDSIAVDEIAEMVNSNEPIGITIECEPGIGTISEHRLLQALRVSRSTAVVDIGAIRVSVDDDDIGTDRSKELASEFRGGTVCGVDHHTDALQ